MRRFTSYGPIDTDAHYYAPRQSLIHLACTQLLGDIPEKGGHYLTVWGPRQTGKTWLMQQVFAHLKATNTYEVAIITMQSAKDENSAESVLRIFTRNLSLWFGRAFPEIHNWSDLPTLFTQHYFQKPLILILDEFDAIDEGLLNRFVNEFRSIYIQRQNEIDKKSAEKGYLLHGLALIGVRSVLGIENVTGSPFNVQRSLHIPNLTHNEVAGMFQEYTEEHHQSVEQAVIDQLFYETQGQPGLVGWLGELLTETYNRHADSIGLTDFEFAYGNAVEALPNNNILNIISKAKQEPYNRLVLELFKTDQKLLFRYDNPGISFLYTNGIVEQEVMHDGKRYLKFASPFVQKRLFHYFANEIFPNLGQLFEPFDNLDDTISDAHLNLKRLLQRYEYYLRQNSKRLLSDAPRREVDLRIYEAVYHFNLYLYLSRFLESYDAKVFPEFPTGNGKIDLLLKHAGQTYGLELKSFSSQREYKKALKQAADYGRQLCLKEITLVLFVDVVDDASRQLYETAYLEPETGVIVNPVFIATT